MGELHVNIILDKIKANQKIEVQTHVPRVAYRETIAKKAPAEFTIRNRLAAWPVRQGCAGDRAPSPRREVQIRQRGFRRGYLQGLTSRRGEGCTRRHGRGVLAGYPVVDVEVKITDGKEHPVDSSELAFKLAARNAFREAMKNAARRSWNPS
jgi:elongation factor G